MDQSYPFGRFFGEPKSTFDRMLVSLSVLYLYPVGFGIDLLLVTAYRCHLVGPVLSLSVDHDRAAAESLPFVGIVCLAIAFVMVFLLREARNDRPVSVRQESVSKLSEAAVMFVLLQTSYFMITAGLPVVVGYFSFLRAEDALSFLRQFWVVYGILTALTALAPAFLRCKTYR